MAKLFVIALFGSLVVAASAQNGSPFGQGSQAHPPQQQPPSGSNLGSQHGSLPNNSGNIVPNGVSTPSPPSKNDVTTQAPLQPGAGEVSTSTIVPILLGSNSSSTSVPSADKHTGHEHSSGATSVAVGTSLLLVLVAPLL